MNKMEQVLDKRIRINYSGRSGYIFYLFIETLFLSLITFGLYLPVGANRLLTYFTQQTDIYMYRIVEKSE